jgi:hypothetical protein
LISLAGDEAAVRSRAAEAAARETPREVAERLERLKGERIGLLFSWLEGRSRKFLPAAYWLAYGVHAPRGISVKVPSYAELIFLRGLIRHEVPGLRQAGRRLIEWSPLAAAAGTREPF